MFGEITSRWRNTPNISNRAAFALLSLEGLVAVIVVSLTGDCSQAPEQLVSGVINFTG